MKTSDFNYQLPEELIAQTPLERRDGSRLMTLDRNTGAWEHHHFYELPDFLNPGDCLILNDSRCCPPVCWVSVCREAAPVRCCCSSTGEKRRGNVWCARDGICGREPNSPSATAS